MARSADAPGTDGSSPEHTLAAAVEQAASPEQLRQALRDIASHALQAEQAGPRLRIWAYKLLTAQSPDLFGPVEADLPVLHLYEALAVDLYRRRELPALLDLCQYVLSSPLPASPKLLFLLGESQAVLGDPAAVAAFEQSFQVMMKHGYPYAEVTAAVELYRYACDLFDQVYRTPDGLGSYQVVWRAVEPDLIYRPTLPVRDHASVHPPPVEELLDEARVSPYEMLTALGTPPGSDERLHLLDLICRQENEFELRSTPAAVQGQIRRYLVRRFRAMEPRGGWDALSELEWRCVGVLLRKTPPESDSSALQDLARASLLSEIYRYTGAMSTYDEARALTKAAVMQLLAADPQSHLVVRGAAARGVHRYVGLLLEGWRKGIRESTVEKELLWATGLGLKTDSTYARYFDLLAGALEDKSLSLTTVAHAFPILGERFLGRKPPKPGIWARELLLAYLAGPESSLGKQGLAEVSTYFDGIQDINDRWEASLSIEALWEENSEDEALTNLFGKALNTLSATLLGRLDFSRTEQVCQIGLAFSNSSDMALMFNLAEVMSFTNKELLAVRYLRQAIYLAAAVRKVPKEQLSLAYVPRLYQNSERLNDLDAADEVVSLLNTWYLKVENPDTSAKARFNLVYPDLRLADVERP